MRERCDMQKEDRMTMCKRERDRERERERMNVREYM